MKRKHRIVVEMTFDRPTTGKNARRIVERICEGDERDQVIEEESFRARSEWTHYDVKDMSRVMAAEKIKMKRSL